MSFMLTTYAGESSFCFNKSLMAPYFTQRRSFHFHGDCVQKNTFSDYGTGVGFSRFLMGRNGEQSENV